MSRRGRQRPFRLNPPAVAVPGSLPLPRDRRERSLLAVLTGRSGYLTREGQGRLSGLPAEILHRIVYTTRRAWSTRTEFRRDLREYWNDITELNLLWRDPRAGQRETWEEGRLQNPRLGAFPTLPRWLSGMPEWRLGSVTEGFMAPTTRSTTDIFRFREMISFRRIRNLIFRFIRRLQRMARPVRLSLTAQPQTSNYVLMDTWATSGGPTGRLGGGGGGGPDS